MGLVGGGEHGRLGVWPILQRNHVAEETFHIVLSKVLRIVEP